MLALIANPIFLVDPPRRNIPAWEILWWELLKGESDQRSDEFDGTIACRYNVIHEVDLFYLVPDQV